MADGMATGDGRTDNDLAHQAKIARIKHLISAWIPQYGAGMHTRLVRKCARGGDGYIKRNGKLEALRDIVVKRGQLRKIIVCQQLGIVNVELRNQAAERGDAVALADAQYGDIEAVRASFEGRDGIGEGAAGVVVAVKFDTDVWVAFRAEAHELLHLARASNADGIGQADTLHAGIDDGIKNGQ